MRQIADRERIERFMRALGHEATTPVRVYFAGGATAVLLGWRASTIHVDIKVVPDSDTILRAIPALKESLDLNIELATPDDFIPVREDWADRSAVVGREGRVTFHHFDLYAQALAKIERGHERMRGTFKRCWRAGSGHSDRPRAGASHEMGRSGAGI